MTKDTSGPAFPTAIPADCFTYDNGMTLRDYFAGQALAGINCDLVFEEANATNAAPAKIFAAAAYMIADAMIAERSK